MAPVVQRVHVGIQGHTRRGLGGIPFIWRFTAVAHADWRMSKKADLRFVVCIARFISGTSTSGTRIELQAEFEEVSKTVASSIGAPVNALNIANTFKSVSNVQNITNKTVSAYLEYMQDAFLVEKSERYDIKGRKYIGSLAKYYYQDVGLRNAILSFRQSEPTHIMENAIYNEMRMRGWLVDVGNIYHRVRNAEGKQQRVTLEVDFVCNKGSERVYIQSAWRLPDAEKMVQEKRSLCLVNDSFRKLLIVGEHTKPWSDENGIQIMSIYDFLLKLSSTEK